MEVVLICCSLTVSSKQKTQMKNINYHGIFIPFKIQLYSKQRTSIFLLFGSWSLVLYIHVWVKVKSFQQLQPDNLSELSMFARNG